MGAGLALLLCWRPVVLDKSGGLQLEAMEDKLGEVGLPEVSGWSARSCRRGGRQAFLQLAASCAARHLSRPWAAPIRWWAGFLSSANLLDYGAGLAHPGQPRAGRKGSFNFNLFLKKKNDLQKALKHVKNKKEWQTQTSPDRSTLFHSAASMYRSVSPNKGLMNLPVQHGATNHSVQHLLMSK